MSNFKEIQDRFKRLSIDLIKMMSKIPKEDAYRNIKYQLTRSGFSSAANIRAASRAKSRADLINKLKIVEEELDETMFWLEIIEELNSTIPVKSHLKEADELLRITVSSIKSLRKQNS